MNKYFAGAISLIAGLTLGSSVAFTGPDSVAVNVSFGSTSLSKSTGTLIVRLVIPGANVSVPDTAV